MYIELATYTTERVFINFAQFLLNFYVGSL